jgi:hypothetical protein
MLLTIGGRLAISTGGIFNVAHYQRTAIYRIDFVTLSILPIINISDPLSLSAPPGIRLTTPQWQEIIY